MAEFIADQELLVRIEGIQMYVDYMSFLTRPEVEKDFVPHLEETLVMLTKDDSSDDEAEARMSHLIGPIVDRLSHLGFLKETNYNSAEKDDEHKLEPILINYFKACISHVVKDVRKGAAYNLPCFFLHFRFWEPTLEQSFDEFDDSRSFLEQFYLELCQAPDTPVDILKCLAAGIHEVMKLFPSENKLPTSISESVYSLLKSKH